MPEQRLTPERRLRGIRLFSSAPDAPRLRRPSDVSLVLVGVLALVPLTLLAPGPRALDHAVTELLHALGSWWTWAWTIGYAVLVIWPAALVLVALARRGRRRLLLDWLVAELLAIGLALVVGRLAGTSWSRSLSAVTATAPPQVYVAARLALATALLVAASPHLTLPLRRTGRVVLAVGALSAVALGIAYPIGALAGFTIGVVAGAGAHLLLGSPDGRLSFAQVTEALHELGLDVDDVGTADLLTPGTALYTARGTDGATLWVKVFGRDAWDSQFLASIWTALVRRGEHPRLGVSRRGQVEHEAVVTLLADQAAVPVARVVTVGQNAEGDAVLVTERVGTPFAELPAQNVEDGCLAAAWRSLTALHRVGITHGRIDRYRLVALPDGRVALTDLSRAELPATADARITDSARLLATTAQIVGPERATAAALAALGAAGMTEVLPYLQPAALDRATRKAIKHHDWDLEPLGDSAQQAAGTTAPELAKLRRVTVKSALIAAGGTLLAIFLVTKLLNIDYSALWKELSSANLLWLAAALVMAPMPHAALAFSTLGASPKSLRYGPVLMLQYAIQFLAVAVPASAARLALEVRFFQRFGLAAAGALSIGVIDSVSGFVVQLSLIAVIALTALPGLTSSIGGSSTSSSSSSSGGSVGTILIIVAVALVLAAVVAVAVPRYRRWIKGVLPKAREMLKTQAQSAREALTVLRRPAKVGEMLAGNLGAQILYAVILGLCLEAFGAHAHLSQLILVNTLVSLFAGFMPVPGGVGVAEAGYVACLQAVGVSDTVAISAALAYRLVTFYLPPLWGSVAMGWLKRNQYL